MLSEQERRWVLTHAYIPEHLVPYIEAVSGAEAFVESGCLGLHGAGHLLFIAYPLERADVQAAFEAACARYAPRTVSLITPHIWLKEALVHGGPDHYFRLRLPIAQVPPKAAYMVRRAERELEVGQAPFGRKHRKLVKAFLRGHEVGRTYARLFRKIPAYLERSPSAALLEACKGKHLAAFSILDLGLGEYAFYLFNFRSPAHGVPGASDLLLFEMIRMAQKAGKRYLNLGLGISPGVRRFKAKWGAEPFLPHLSLSLRREDRGLESLARKLCVWQPVLPG